jgi:cytochrome c
MRTILTVVAVAGALAAGAGAVLAQDVAKAKGCMNCHAVDAKKAGPSFKAIAAKHKDTKDAQTTLAAKLKDGKGHMKINASDADINAAVKEMLSAK